jgi:hypothetical protein
MHFGIVFAYNMQTLSTTGSRLILGLITERLKLCPTVLTAKVESLSSTFGVESGCFVNGHSADGVFG